MSLFPTRHPAPLPRREFTTIRKVFHVFCLGGSGAIHYLALLLNLLASGMSNIEVMAYFADFDAGSDAKEDAKEVTRALSRMARILHEQKDHSHILGALYRTIIAGDLIISSTDEYGKTTLEFLLERIPEEDRAEVETALRLMLPDQILTSTLGQGGYASSSLGAICASHNASRIHQMLDQAVDYIKNHRDCEHAAILLTSLFGATGLSFTPVFLRRIAEIQTRMKLPTFAVFDAGTFYAHSSSYEDERYHGTPDVKGKGAGSIVSLEQQGLLDVLECAIVMTPLRESGDPYKACPTKCLEGHQKRHSTIEPLIATGAIIKLATGCDQDDVLQALRSSGRRIFEIKRSPDCPQRPLNWADMGLNASDFHSLIRMLATGAAMKNFILTCDDSVIQDIPALAPILKDKPLAQVKAEIAEIANGCHILTQQLYDICVTGTDWEQDPADMHIEDAYRLANTTDLAALLDGKCSVHYNVSNLCSYPERIGDKGAVKNRTVSSKATCNKSIKHYIDRIRATSTEDFFIQLFKLAR